ncbi:MAG: dienelactone hydrolase family protein [Halobacteria archaeon]|nr:dienelactone hydrolase family protein [Halobacteria archaeon]
MFRAIPIVLLMLFSLPSQGSLVGEEVSYQAGDTTLKGYIAYDAAVEGRRPGILVVHEWWGHNDYARKRAERLAALGYTALAVDMYGEGKTADHPDDAGKFAGAIRQNLPLMQSRFEAAREFLTRHPTVDPESNAAIGYCFGGGVVLEMARQGLDLDAVVSFHGSLGGGTRAEAGKVKARILVANGADDPFVSAEQISAFKAEMDAAGADYTFINYPGARHSFTNPDADRFGESFDLPLAYDAAADADSWRAMLELFAATFRQAQ